MVLLHQGIAVSGFDAPQRQQRAALDPKILFDPRKQRLVLLQRFLAGDDAPVRDAAIDVLPDLLVELRLLLHLLEHGHIRLDAAHHAGPGRVRNALRQCARAKAVAPLIEAGRCRGKCRERMREQGAGTEAGSQQRPARRGFQRIRMFHAGSLAAQGGARQRQKSLRPGTSHPAAALRRFWTTSGAPSAAPWRRARPSAAAPGP